VVTSDEALIESTAPEKPSSFIHQLQSRVDDISQSPKLTDTCNDVNNSTAYGCPQTVNVTASPSSPAFSRDPIPPQCWDTTNAGPLQCALIAVNACHAGETPIPPTSSSTAVDFRRLPLLQPQTQRDPTAVVVVPPLPSLFGNVDIDTDAKLDVGDDGCAFRRPLSSSWATALAAASIAGKAAAAGAVKRRPNSTKSGGASVNIRALRSLFCLTTSNPIRKHCINVVEWKYPLLCVG